jgi:hypothetical protein
MIRIPRNQYVALVKFWQAEHGLEVDGILGPKTRASIHRSYISVDTPDASQFMNRAISYALADVGEVEVGNNGGAYVRGLRRYCGFPEGSLGPWCAIFGSAKLKRAGQSLWGNPSTLPFSLSRGAYRLVMNVGEAGRFITPEELVSSPGLVGVACWKRRGWLLQRKAHFRFFTGYSASSDTLHCVAGNEKDGVRVVSLKDGAWRKDLVRMATI